MDEIYDTKAIKKATNLRINSDLIAKARALGINLSATLERALIEEIKRRQRAQWLKENAGAIEAYNQFVEERGVFSDGSRSF
ncbi:MAG: acetoacetyl-CoA synthase [Calditrichaeota bacterium]|nr:MAG: acetoacetyl-CoA synthase [Calditrichota bacterium]